MSEPTPVPGDLSKYHRKYESGDLVKYFREYGSIANGMVGVVLRRHPREYLSTYEVYWTSQQRKSKHVYAHELMLLKDISEQETQLGDCVGKGLCGEFLQLGGDCRKGAE